MAVDVRNSWKIAGLTLALLCALLGWASFGGGARPLSAQAERAMVPQVGQ